MNAKKFVILTMDRAANSENVVRPLDRPTVHTNVLLGQAKARPA